MNSSSPSEPHGPLPAEPMSRSAGFQLPVALKDRLTTLLATPYTATSATDGPTASPPAPLAFPTELDSPTANELAAAVGTRRSFSPTVPGLQLVWDATSISSFLACPTRYYYSIVLGLTPATKSVHLTFGGAYQRALETYDRERLRGIAHREATVRAVTVGYREGASLPLEKQPADLAVTEPTPPAEVKRRDMLVKAIVDHCEQYADDPLRTVVLANGEPAVELSFRYDSGLTLLSRPVEFSGHFDRVVAHGSGPDASWYILDHKTSKRPVDTNYRAKFELSTQMSHYDFSAAVVLPRKPVGVIIDSVQMLVDAVRTTRFPLRFTPSQSREYYEDLQQLLPAAGNFVAQRRWPRNRESCMLCDFKKLCRVDASIRPHIAATEFTRRLWDPAEPRVEGFSV